MPAPPSEATIGVLLSDEAFADAWEEAGGQDPRMRALLRKQAVTYLEATRDSHGDPLPLPMLPDLLDVLSTETDYRHERRLTGLMHQRAGVAG